MRRSRSWAIRSPRREFPVGCVRLAVIGLEANAIKVEAIPAGEDGSKSNDMLARVDRDVIPKKPDWMTFKLRCQ